MNKETLTLTSEGIVPKEWGHENIIISTNLYCIKKLIFFDKYGSTSMHFHKLKTETFFIERGSFLIKTINPTDATINNTILDYRDLKQKKITIYPLTMHQIISLDNNSVLSEVSTGDFIEDSYRIYRTSKEQIEKELS